MKKTAYRTWYDPEERTDNFLRILPNGAMLQLSFHKNLYGDKVEVYQSSPVNPLDHKVFLKHKDVCLKSKWISAQKHATSLIKGIQLPSGKI